ncbi:MAG: hypothetical protein WC876_02005 [Candidatus Thermoplasmatota archaeon]|jgi:hypothetical protein
MPHPKSRSGHTAGEWRLAEPNCGDGYNIAAKVSDPDHPAKGLYVAVAHTSAVRTGGADVVSPAQAKANAERIVLAVNSYDATLAALDALVLTGEAVLSNLPQEATGYDAHQSAILAARAVLLSARGGK